MNCLTTNAQFKRGDTFILAGVATVKQGGTPIPDLTGWTGRCQLRDLRGNLVANLGFEWLDAAERLWRINYDDTASWPLGLVQLDLKFTNAAGQRVSTATSQFTIIKSVTEEEQP